MIQERNRYIPEDKIKPLYLKCSITLSKLIEYLEVNKTKYYQQVTQLYKDINTENAVKLLMRCQKLLKARDNLITIFKQIIKREEISHKFKCNSSCVTFSNVRAVNWYYSRWKDQTVSVVVDFVIIGCRSINEDSKYFFKLSHNIWENIWYAWLLITKANYQTSPRSSKRCCSYLTGRYMKNI